MHETHDVVGRFSDDRVAGVGPVDDLRGGVVQRGAGVKEVHLGTRHHQFTEHAVAGVVFVVGQQRLGIAGVKGFGGGFAGAEGSAFGEAEMKAFIDHARYSAESLEHSLHSLDSDYRVAVTHYSPTPGTLHGEHSEIYPFLGSRMLAEAIDVRRVDLVLHGHAHHGSERGETPGGVPVRNVAQPVIGAAFAVYTLDPRVA